MKYTIKRDSILHKILTEWSNQHWSDDFTDICTLITSILKFFVASIVVISILIVIFGSAGMFLHWVGYGILFGFIPLDSLKYGNFITLGAGMFICILLIAGTAILDVIQKKSKKIQKDKKPSLLKAAYERFKNKTCVIIDIED